MADQEPLAVHEHDNAAVIAIVGEVTAASEGALADANARSGTRGPLVLDFTGLAYMNSSGIGLVVTLLVRARRQGRRMLAFGLTDHYRQIFELTRLDEAIEIHVDEAAALAASS